MGSIASKYTTDEKLKKDPIGEKDKLILSNDAFAICELLETLNNRGLR